MQTKTKRKKEKKTSADSRAAFVIASHPINIHLNNNEIIIIFTEQKKLKLDGFHRYKKKIKLSSHFNSLKHCCELWRLINIILIYIQAIIYNS